MWGRCLPSKSFCVLRRYVAVPRALMVCHAAAQYQPRKGDAVLFYSVHPNGEPAPASHSQMGRHKAPLAAPEPLPCLLAGHYWLGSRAPLLHHALPHMLLPASHLPPAAGSCRDVRQARLTWRLPGSRHERPEVCGNQMAAGQADLMVRLFCCVLRVISAKLGFSVGWTYKKVNQSDAVPVNSRWLRKGAFHSVPLQCWDVPPKP